MITLDRVREALSYDPSTGKFTWLVSHRRGSDRRGQRAGYKLAQGHIRIKVDGVEYPAHRLAWLYMTGELPAAGVQVDHVNCVRDDNRWSNLRLATPAQNKWNSYVTRVSKSRLKGVSRSYGKWRAAIKVHGVYRSLGVFDCPAAASFAYQIAADISHGEYANPGFQGA